MELLLVPGEGELKLKLKLQFIPHGNSIFLPGDRQLSHVGARALCWPYPSALVVIRQHPRCTCPCIGT